MPQSASLANGYTDQYDEWNRRVELKNGTTTVATYRYDGATRRVTKWVGSNTTHFHYFDRNNPMSPIYGELYLMDDATFADLDALEGHRSYSRRYLTRVTLSEGTVKAAWICFGNYPPGPIVPSGRDEEIR